MADVSHELGALRFVVESPLSSKVAMFNNHAQQHKHSQSLNPFSAPGSRASSPKPTFSKDEYGKPLAGSLTEMRGQKANMHVLREMLELCQIISSEGYDVKDEPGMRVIPFGELFNIYNYISDKVVGILLRARKHKLVDFEGEMLFQRRDDDVPVFLLRPILEIRRELEGKIDDIKRGASPAPQATSVLLDRGAHGRSGLSLPSSKRNSKSRSSSPKPPPTKIEVEPVASLTELLQNPTKDAATTTGTEYAATSTQTNKDKNNNNNNNNDAAAVKPTAEITITPPPPDLSDLAKPVDANEVCAKLVEAIQTSPIITDDNTNDENNSTAETSDNEAKANKTTASSNEPTTPSSLTSQNTDELPTVVMETTAVYVRNTADAKESTESMPTTAPTNTTTVSS